MSDAKDHPEQDEAWEGGLREAFRRDRPAPGSSVLARIGARRGSAPRVNLRDIPDENTPVIRPKTDETDFVSERYQVVGELARGGVGVILKGRDVDLGRDVAMKLLLDEHTGNAQLLERFVEEAQVGGQLQHPGIVPVYEIGVQEDGRPFFAMKLVKGRTLSALLTDRKGLRDDRRRFLAILEQVCLTVAYAHARGVIHRDLKPSNVMVGAFGEVLVVDWGFAKILTQGGVADEERASAELSVIETVRSGSEGSGASVAGSVMGTPAYMPPEQARGELEKMDERADVFALGSVLTEILTGKPTYAPEDGNQLIQAGKAELSPALARLDGCGADEGLVSLAKRCLEPDPKDRPRNAGEIAEALGEHLASVEERAQAARVEAARAQVRALAERRTRRLTVALAASILLALVVGGGAFLWNDRRERDRLAAATREVGDALVAAGQKLGEARTSEPGDLARWPAAVEAAEKAVEVAKLSRADEATLASADAFLAKARKAESSAREIAASIERDRGTKRRLLALRLMRGKDFDPEEVDRGFREAFSAHGIEVNLLTADQLVEVVNGSRIRDDLFHALERWSHVVQEAVPDDVESLSRLREAVRRLDPDPFRTRVRLLAEAGQVAKLQRLKEEADLDELPVESRVVLATALLRHDLVAAGNLLHAAREEEPEDFRTNSELAMALLAMSNPNRTRLRSVLEAALVAEPEAYGLRYHLGVVLRPDNVEGALAAWREVYRRGPTFGRVRDLLVEAQRGRLIALYGASQFEAAEAAAREILDLDPGDVNALVVLGQALCNRTNWRVVYRPLSPEDEERLEEAVALLERAVEQMPDDPRCVQALGQALRYSRRWEEAIAQFERAVDLFGGSSGSAHANLGGLLLFLGDDEGAEKAYRAALALPSPRGPVPAH